MVKLKNYSFSKFVKVELTNKLIKMKNYYFKTIVFLFFIVAFMACKKELLNAEVESNKSNYRKINSEQMVYGDVLTGFNVKWNYVPALTQLMPQIMRDLSPKLLRYPGGTITHSWDWLTGLEVGATSGIAHKMPDVATVAYETGAKMTFVIDILHSSITNQINMLNNFNDRMRIKTGNSSGNFIEYVELGNEIYSTHYQMLPGFQTGEEYAMSIEPWAAAIKAQFPLCKIGVSLVSNAGGNPRKQGWNRGTDADSILIKDPGGCTTSGSILDTVYNHLGGVIPYINSNATLKNNIDAYIYHIYISGDNSCTTMVETSTAQERIDDFEDTRYYDRPGTNGKEIWVTEYGNLNDTEDVNDLKELNKLADYLQSNSEIKVALNHVMFGATQNNPDKPLVSKLSLDGLTYTTGGKLFLRRANPVVINEIYNAQTAYGAGDKVELLVVQNALNMENLILKNFSANGTADNGVSYKFNTNSIWGNLKSGTLIVIKKGTSAPVYSNNNYTITVGVNNTDYFTSGNPSVAFDVSDGDGMWMIKNPNFDASGMVTGTTDGISNPIHTLAAGSSTASFYNYSSITGPKLYSSTGWSTTAPSSVYAKNLTSKIYDYRDETGTNATTGTTNTLGASNNTTNGTYIDGLVALGW